MAYAEPIDDVQLRAVSEKARLMIYATPRPIRRLRRDVNDISRFDGPGVLTPQLRLLFEFPPLVPVSTQILDAASRLYGWSLFDAPLLLLLDSMALIGPIATAETFILLMDDSKSSEKLCEIGDAFIGVFERYPEIFLAQTRETLGPYMCRKDLKKYR